MAEKLGEIGDVLSGISKAVKTMKSLQDDRTELYRVIEQTKKHASEVEQLDLADEPLLKELKLELEKVWSSGSKLEVWLQNFGKEIQVFERFVRTKITINIPPEVVREFCEMLISTHRMASDFSAAFDDFIGLLFKAQQIAMKLTDELKKKADELEKKAAVLDEEATELKEKAAELEKKAAELDEEVNRTKKRGAKKIAGLAIGAIGLTALGFFTGGAAWIAAGTVAGTACGVGAGVVTKNTAVNMKACHVQAACAVKEAGAITEEAKEKVLNVKAMHELARDFSVNSNKLEVIAKQLKSSGDKAETIQLDKKAIEALQTALEFFRKDLEKDDRIALQQAEIAELKNKMRIHGIK